MKISTLIGLVAVGGVVYAHQKSGNEWSLDGFKRTMRDLASGARERARDIADTAKDRIHDAAQDTAPTTGYSTPSGFDYNR